ncbi:MAG: hypothetical protein ACOX8S_11365 [Christensenellales bacterium]|jgi:uncharacterized protein YrrD
MFLSKMLDLPIIDISSGDIVSKTIGWLLRRDCPQLLCLLARPESWYENAAYLPFGGITGISARAVMISSRDQITPLRLHDEIPDYACDCRMGIGSGVYTPSGDFLGETADIKIDDRGRIKHLLLGNGSSVSASRILTIGAAFIVSEASSPLISFAADEGIKIASNISNEIVVRKVQP